MEQRIENRLQTTSLKLRANLLFVFLSVVYCLSSVICFAKDIRFEASVDRNKVSLGSAITLNLTFYGTRGMPAPKLSEIDGFQSQYKGPSTRMSMVNGKISSSITHIYTLIPMRVGKFRIGHLSFKHKKKSYFKTNDY